MPMPIEMKPGAVLRSAPPRRVSPAVREQMELEIQTLLDSGVIRPSSAPQASPVLMVRKPDGKYRLCVDYRRLNEQTVDLKCPMQSKGEVLESLAGKRVFVVLDLRSGFHQIRIAEEEIGRA